VRTEKGGNMPVDPTPGREGNIRVIVGGAPGNKDLGVVLSGHALNMAKAADERLYTSHFASCAAADEWRQK